MNKTTFAIIMKKTFWAALLLCLPLCACGQRKGNMSQIEQSLRKLSMAHLAISSLYVDSVDEVKLTEDAINVTVRLSDSDMGKVIGKQGKIAKALRTLVRAATPRDSKKYNVEIKERSAE